MSTHEERLAAMERIALSLEGAYAVLIREIKAFDGISPAEQAKNLEDPRMKALLERAEAIGDKLREWI